MIFTTEVLAFLVFHHYKMKNFYGVFGTEPKFLLYYFLSNIKRNIRHSLVFFNIARQKSKNLLVVKLISYLSFQTVNFIYLV